MKIEPQATEQDPFVHANSPPAIMAFIHAKMGAEGLQALLAEITADRESLERDAAELDAVGLPDVATIVMEAASTALSAGVMYCPYDESNAHNFDSWQAAYHRRQKAKS